LMKIPFHMAQLMLGWGDSPLQWQIEWGRRVG
jgi:hypothetical protein